MAHRKILFRSAACEKMLRGTTQLADAIRVMLGPRSKAVLIERKWGTPIVASILLLTKATMTEIPEKQREKTDDQAA